MTAAATMSPGEAVVRGRYAALAADQGFVSAAPIADRSATEQVAAFVAFEARLLDSRRFVEWLALWAPDGLLWVPIDPASHPASDQSFFLDDLRRLGERVGRFDDPSAWSSNPMPVTVRVVGGIEAWPSSSDREFIARTVSTVAVRRGPSEIAVVVVTVYRLRDVAGELHLVHKIISVPALRTGVTDLSVLL